ncbi:origin recognition complex subunit 4 [Chamberlinius hualienensis]
MNVIISCETLSLRSNEQVTMSKLTSEAKKHQEEISWIKIRNFLEKSINKSFKNHIIQYELQKRNVVDALKRTADRGENNSLIIIGPKGSGKSTLVKCAVDEALSDCDSDENVIQVHLNGYLQTDDRIAINEITRQLQLESTTGDNTFGSFAENLAFLLESLKSGNSETKAVFFILDEFDLFCHHHNQTLLYNLFDVTQNSQTPIAVVGMTRRLDVLELLEKRVKSRFSHRQILLFPKFTFEDFLQLTERILQLEDVYHSKFASKWNNNIKKLLQNDSTKAILRKLFDTTKDISNLKSFLALPLYYVNPEDCILNEKHFARAWDYLTQESKQHLLGGVSVLELSLLLCMRRLVEIYDGEAFNFEMVYNEYQKFAETRSSYNYNKRVVTKAFENLLKMELVGPIEGANSKVQKNYRLVNLLVDTVQIMDTLQTYSNLPTEILQWSSSLIA